MGKLTLLLLALLVWLQYSLWFGKNGLHDYTRVNDDVTAQQATNAKLKARNDQLFAEIDDLNGGQEAHIVQVYAALGCRVHARRSQDEWVALELLRA